MRIPLPAKSIIRHLLANIQLSTCMNAIHYTCEYPLCGSAVTEIFGKIGPGGSIFSEKNGPSLKILVRPSETQPTRPPGPLTRFAWTYTQFVIIFSPFNSLNKL